MIWYQWLGLAGVLLTFGVGLLVLATIALGTLQDLADRLPWRRRESKLTVNDLLTGADIGEALQAFDAERGDCDALLLVWLGRDGQLRIASAGLCDLERLGLLEHARGVEDRRLGGV